MLEIFLDEFHVSTLWNGGIVLFTLFAIIAYIFILPSGKDHTIGKSVLFYVGLVALFIALGSPVNVIARMKYSTHIIQLIFLLIIAPPFLIYGFKKESIKKMREIEFIDRICNKLRVLTKPRNAFIIFFALFYLYHVPFFFNFVRIDLFLNYLLFFALFVAAILLWIPVISEKSTLTAKQKIRYGLLSIVFFIPYSIILFMANEGIYALYTNVELFTSSLALCVPDVRNVPPEFFLSLLPYDPVEEQHLGGIILLISQIILIIGFTIWGTKIKAKPHA